MKYNVTNKTPDQKVKLVIEMEGKFSEFESLLEDLRSGYNEGPDLASWIQEALGE